MTNLRRISILLAGVLLSVGVAAAAWAGPVRSRGPTSPRAPARAFLTTEIHSEAGGRAVYVGQAEPVTIRAYFLGGTGVSLNGQPRVSSDAFVLSDLPEKPRQADTQIGGLPYTSLTWTGVLTAVEAGPARPEIALPVELSFRDAPRLGRGSQTDTPEQGEDQDASDPFASILKQTPFAADPFFAQMFNGHDPFRGMLDDLAGTIRQRDVTLRVQNGTLRVLDLPAGAPAGFTGAVGSFQISAAPPVGAFRVGEPIALELRVRGKGSFSRLALGGLAPSDDFNAYGVTAAYTPGQTPVAGEKVFTQTIAPRRAGALMIPAVALTYFDPRDRKYVTRRTAAMNVAVAPSESEADRPSPTADFAGPVENATGLPAAPPSTALAELPATVHETLTPSFRTRGFHGLVGAIGLVALALALFGRTYRAGALGRWLVARRLRREVARQRRAIDVALARGDAGALFGAARKALQARLGSVWGVPSEAIAAADVAARMGARGGQIHEVFERADRFTYAGGGSATREDLTYWRGLVSEELHNLEVTS